MITTKLGLIQCHSIDTQTTRSLPVFCRMLMTSFCSSHVYIFLHQKYFLIKTFKNIQYIFHKSIGWRIQDFARLELQRGRAGAIIWQIFCRKLHANERNWTEREVHLGHSLVDRHSKILDLRFPSRSNFLHFDAVLGKFWPNNRLAPSPLELAPPLCEMLDPLQSCGGNQRRNNKNL